MVRTWEAEKPFTSDTMLSSTNRIVQEVKQNTEYTDGLGRPIQIVLKSISPNGFDLVSSMIYDSLGREAFKYLPYISPGTDGNFKLSPFTEQSSFSSRYYNPLSNANGETFFYSRLDFEPSPINRITAGYPQGNSWVGNGAGISLQYSFNIISDSVVIWTIPTSQGSTPSSYGFYGYGQLFKNITINEQGIQTIEFKDKDGRMVLKKVQIGSTTSSLAYTGWLCTYYVYDDFNNLRFILQPQAVATLLASGWSFGAGSWRTSTIAQGLCFSYEYDLRKRILIKRVPGGNEEWTVYDSRDRVVMTQDSLQRTQGNWLYIQYDSLNRPVLTGIWANSGDINFHQALAATSASYPLPLSNFTILTKTWYDDYSVVSANGSGLSSSLISTPGILTNFYPANDNTFPYPRAIVSSGQTKGLITASSVSVLGNSNYLFSVNFYDDRSRMIQTNFTNNSGGKDTLTIQYGFTGKILRTFIGHGKAGSNALSYAVLTKNYYDVDWRLTSVVKKFGNSNEDSILVNKYDEYGRLGLKKLGQTRTSLTNLAYTSNPIDTLRYTYNVRGWLKGINKDYANAINGAVNWFGMELSYDFGFSQNQLNGNIGGTKWRNQSDGAQRAYGFSYDPANRLIKADFTQSSGGNTWDLSAGIDFSVHSLSYDNNGNILSLNQMGMKLNAKTLVDSLLYSYNANSNQLNYVTDRVNDTSAHLGDFTEINNIASQDYSYDGNGNLSIDNNKGISNIHYNFLNLPDSVSFGSKGYIKFFYDAYGRKQQRITIDNILNKKTVISYLGSFIYQYTATPSSGTGLDTLQFALTEEGRIRPKTVAKSDTVFYDFFEKDHLGNTRVVLTDEMAQDIYPAATVEANANSLNMLKAYYSINLADTISVNRIASWNLTTGNNYQNNNGNPPVNNDPYLSQTATSNFVYRLNGATGDKSGLGITLKVMSGDVIDIWGKSFWHNNGSVSNSYPISIALTNFLLTFAGTPAVVASGHGAATAIANAIGNSSSDIGNIKYLLDTGKASTGTVPRAYVNWILFDEQFNPVKSGSGFDPINTTPDNVKTHHKPVSISSSGYLYVYCSNESNNDVFFDNLQLIQTRGPLVESTNYYPFGLTMAGICSKAAGRIENKYKFNGGTERNSDLGFNLDETDFRLYDPQLGRFQQVDLLATMSEVLSPYVFGSNNPILRNDPLGLRDTVVNGEHGSVSNPEQEVVVSATKKNCKTCTPKFNIDVSKALEKRKGLDGVNLPTIVITPLKKKDSEKDYENIIDFISNWTEHGEKVTKALGYEDIAKKFGGASDIMTVAGAANHAINKDWKGLAKDGVEYYISKSPVGGYYYSAKVIQAMLMSDYNLSAAYNNFELEKTDLINNFRFYRMYGTDTDVEVVRQQIIKIETSEQNLLLILFEKNSKKE
jgi:RHS repeat-associated protein